MTKKIVGIAMIMIFALYFNNSNNAHARIPSMTSVYSSGWSASFLNEEKEINVQVGNNVISDPCGKTVKLKSSRPQYDVITEINSEVECNFGHTYFKIKSSQAGTSQITVEIDGTVIASRNFSFFIKRSDNVLVSPIGHPHVFIIKNGYKYRIKSPSMLYAHGYKWSDIIDIDPVEEHLYSLGRNMKMEALTYIDGHINYIYNDLKLPVSQGMINGLSLDSHETHQISDKNLVWQLRRMNLLLNKSNKKVYYITSTGKKRHILNEAVFNSYNNKWEDVVEVSDDFLKSFSDVSLVKADGDYKVYKLENGKKKWIKTAEVFNRLGFRWDEIAPVNILEISEYPDGEIME